MLPIVAAAARRLWPYWNLLVGWSSVQCYSCRCFWSRLPRSFWSEVRPRRGGARESFHGILYWKFGEEDDVFWKGKILGRSISCFAHPYFTIPP